MQNSGITLKIATCFLLCDILKNNSPKLQVIHISYCKIQTAKRTNQDRFFILDQLAIIVFAVSADLLSEVRIK